MHRPRANTQIAPAPALDYAAHTDADRRRGHTKRIIKVIFILALATLLIAWSWRAIDRMKIWWSDRSAAKYTEPPDIVVWSRQASNTRGRIVFEHRRALGERARIVSVTSFDNPNGDCGLMVVVRPIQLLNEAIRGERSVTAFDFLGNYYSYSIDKAYAGQIDPADESHFTIDYELNGKKGVIDGWLTDEDRVKLEPRDPSLRSLRWMAD